MSETDKPQEPRTMVTLVVEIVQCKARIAELKERKRQELDESDMVQCKAGLAELQERLTELQKERKRLESSMGGRLGSGDDSALGDSLGSGARL